MNVGCAVCKPSVPWQGIFLFSLATQSALKTIICKSYVNLNPYHLLCCPLFVTFILFNCGISCKQGASTLLFAQTKYFGA